jgi:cation diffusion facilitator family transporter
MDKVQKLALGSIVVSAVVLGLKYLAYRLTGSIALYSDALESIINVATACAAFYAIRVSAAPPDAGHPYGHYKAEYLSAVLEGMLILVAAFAIFREAYYGFFAPRTIAAPIEGMLVNAGASVINGLWAFVLVRYGKRWKSPAVVADGRHLWADVLSSFAVVAGLALVVWTGQLYFDSVLAMLVAVNILWAGWKLMRESIGGLMDEALPEETLAQVRDLISRHADGALEAHDLRTRHAGRATFIDFHLVVPGTMTVSDSHALCDQIEAALRAAVDNAIITIHVEPEEKAKHHGGVPIV